VYGQKATTLVFHWRNLKSPDYILWVYYLHSNFCGELQKMHLFCNRVRIGRSRSSKVVDFGKGVCNFLLVINSNFYPRSSSIKQLLNPRTLIRAFFNVQTL